MFQPKAYTKKDNNFIFNFIKTYPFATMIMCGEKMLATHIPVLAEGTAEDFIMYGHMARHNELCKMLQDGKEALLIFKSPDAYVSSSWYQEKDISTWDYAAVHVTATLKLQSSEELHQSLQKLIATFEKKQQCPVYAEDIPEDIWKSHFPKIIGFWLEPVAISAIAKLHQDFEETDIKTITQNLKETGDPTDSAVSHLIKKNYDKKD